jgi:hypothetical protein
MVEAFYAICVDRMLKTVSAINAHPARLNYQGQHNSTPAPPSASLGGYPTFPLTKALSPGIFAGHSPPPPPTPAPALSPGGCEAEPWRSPGGAAAWQTRGAVVEAPCNLSVPLEEAGVLRLKEIPAAFKSGPDFSNLFAPITVVQRNSIGRADRSPVGSRSRAGARPR